MGKLTTYSSAASASSMLPVIGSPAVDEKVNVPEGYALYVFTTAAYAGGMITINAASHTTKDAKVISIAASSNNKVLKVGLDGYRNNDGSVVFSLVPAADASVYVFPQQIGDVSTVL